MKKCASRLLSALLVLCIALALLPGTAWAAASNTPKVRLSPQKLSVDGKNVECEKYNIDGSNYFKLRDLAYMLNGTGSQFGVEYDNATKTVRITTGAPYTPNGTELATGVDNSVSAQRSGQTITINGQARSDLTVYNIGGSNFFQLRELENILGFDVDFDEGTNTAIVRSSYIFTPVPMDKLANRKSLQKRATNDQLAQAYAEAVKLVTPYAGLSLEEQLWGIAISLRQRFENGMDYSMESSHYNDPYGYFIEGSASCAGCTRATGLCLNILGISYEHVNEDRYSHQWCRVNVNGVYWICDAYGLYCGPEPAPYTHPYLR